MNQGIKLLKDQIEEIEDLKHPPAYHPQYRAWKDTVIRILRQYFDEGTLHLFQHQGSIQMAMTPEHHYHLYLKRLDEEKQLLGEIIKQQEKFADSNSLDISRSVSLSNYDLHPEVKSVSLSLFEDKHYAQAVEEAFKKIIQEVKTTIRVLTGESLDGDRLMNRAFGCEGQKPIIKFNSLKELEDLDEQKGLMYLFKGIVGIRNKKAHVNVILDDPIKAIEYLSLASLLMRLLDEFTKPEVK